MITAMVDVVREMARCQPLAIALECEGSRSTWRDLQDRSARVAQGLLREGLGREDRVLILGRSDIAFFELLFGSALSGVVTVPINWRLTQAEIAAIVLDSGAQLLFVSEAFAALVREILRDVPALRRVIVIGDRGQEGGDYERWLAAQPVDAPYAPADPEAVALQLYTSGTTGVPKGVMLTNANLAGYWSQGELFGFDVNSVNLVTLPLFHIAGIWWALVGMAQGARTVLTPEFNAEFLLDTVPAQGVTHTVLVPAILQSLSRRSGIEDVDFSSLHTIMYGAAPISKTLLDRCLAIFGCAFYQTYGLSEAAGAVTLLSAQDHLDEAHVERLGSVGRPMPGVSIRIVDPENRADVPEGAAGEIWIRSAQVMRGYWNKDEDSAGAIAPGAWLRTGDVGYLTDGFVYLCDRLKDMILTGGENVYPTEVENVLMAHPDIADVAVIGIPSEAWGEEVKAIVVPVEGRTPDILELASFARKRLAGYKIPKSFEFVGALPRTSSGKVLKRELRETYWKGHRRLIA